MEQAAQPSESKSQDPWEQGDYALGVGGFLYAVSLRQAAAAKPDKGVSPADGSMAELVHASDAGSEGEATLVEARPLEARIEQTPEPYEIEHDDSDVVGLVVISQTCDILRSEFIAVAPLVEASSDDLRELKAGTKPGWHRLQNSPAETVFVDLGRVMSVHRSLLAGWRREKGCSDENGRLKLADAIERKFGRFAFPDDINESLKKLRRRIIEKHKAGDETGKAFRSIMEIRVRCAPAWYGPGRKMSLIAIIRDRGARECSVEVIEKVMRDECDKIKWPAGVEWDADVHRCQVGTADDITVRQLDESRAMDLNYLS